MKRIIALICGAICFMAYFSTEHYWTTHQYFLACAVVIVSTLLLATIFLVLTKKGEKIIDQMLATFSRKGSTITQLRLN